jgi:hypothetical protein
MKPETQVMLSKLVGMLGSDSEHECLAAVRAIKRLLTSERLSISDLVALVQGGKKSVQMPKYDGLAGMAADILAKSADRLKPHERKFVQSIMTRATITPHYRMTEKQANWFGYLFDTYA